MRLPARPVPQGRPVAPLRRRTGGLALRLDGAKVVVVDDQRDSCELLAALFEQCGAQVVQCGNAPAALSTLLSSSVQLLVADIAMPDVDGYDSIRQVRQIDARLPAVAVTAYAYPQDRLKALAAGFRVLRQAHRCDALPPHRPQRDALVRVSARRRRSTAAVESPASPIARTDDVAGGRPTPVAHAALGRTPATHVARFSPAGLALHVQ